MHTAIRPLGGALIAIGTLGDASPEMKTLVGLLGGTLAAGTHFTKAGTRAVANTSPEPFSNWILSLSEDVFVVSLGFIALKYPLVAAAVVLVAVVLMLVFATWIARAVRRRWRRSASHGRVARRQRLSEAIEWSRRQRCPQTRTLRSAAARATRDRRSLCTTA